MEVSSKHMQNILDFIKSVLGAITFLTLLPIIWATLYLIRKATKENDDVDQEEKAPSGFRKFLWFINGKCWECGEEPEPHFNGKYYCKNGHKC